MAVTLTALGYCIAWRMESTHGFHAGMSAFLLPRWLLSGAFFPAEGLPTWLGFVITINPLAYGVAALRRALFLGESVPGGAIPSMTTSLTVTLVFFVLTFVLAYWLTGRRIRGDYR